MTATDVTGKPSTQRSATHEGHVSGIRLRLLPADHAVWFADESGSGIHDGSLWRRCVLPDERGLLPDQSVVLLGTTAEGRELEAPEEVKKAIEARVQIGQNVVAYATNRTLKEKLDRPNTRPPAQTAGKTITNSMGMKLVLIPAGEFLMGSPSSEAERSKTRARSTGCGSPSRSTWACTR